MAVYFVFISFRAGQFLLVTVANSITKIELFLIVKQESDCSEIL